MHFAAIRPTLNKLCAQLLMSDGHLAAGGLQIHEYRKRVSHLQCFDDRVFIGGKFR
jgi:hypothetical protein